MLFSSITFIYYFLPLLLLVYYIVPNKYKNYILLIFSLLFYTLGEPKYVLLLVLSSIVNYYLGKKIGNNTKPKLFLIIAIIYNVLSLFLFKYMDFFIENINAIFSVNISKAYIPLPLGISFYTFQALGYVIDVYNKKHKPSSSILNFMTYISLFPQLVAGPIVRYATVEKELIEREHTQEKFALGIKRFIIGLAKKVLLANVLGEFSKAFITSSIVSSWLKPISYTLQIYFDFSGYSDMTIGLGLMFGFTFPENFNYPLAASSVTDFWRRWHISLSSWFRDYVYIPLGGNRVGKVRQIINILVVWFLTGFWHGASWNFIIWGLYFAIILITEKLFLLKYIEKTKVLKHIYTIFVVTISFLIFNTLSLSDILTQLKNIFGLNALPFINKEAIYYLRSYGIILIVSIISATPLLKSLIIKIKETKLKKIIFYIEPLAYLILLTLETSFLIDESFNPFLYFRF